MAAITINWEPDSKTLRQFGAIGVVAFSAFALLAYFQIWVFANLPIRSYYVLGPLAAYCGVFSLASPVRLAGSGLACVGASFSTSGWCSGGV